MTRVSAQKLVVPAALLALVVLAFPLAASASPIQIVIDCQRDGRLDRAYSKQELQRAIDELPSDIDEYGDCRQIIEGALTSGSAKAGGGGGGPRGPSATPPSAAESGARAHDAQVLEKLTQGGTGSDAPSIAVGDEEVEPGSNGLFDVANASNDLPLPMLLALIALGLLAIAGSALALRGRIPALSRAHLPRVQLPRFRR